MTNMSIIKNTSNFIKYGSYIYDDSARVIGSPVQKAEGPVIKAQRTALSYAEKYRLGILTYPEYLMWQAQIALGLASANEGNQVEEAQAEKPKTDSSSGRFWEQDSALRQNVSDDDYEKFLRENSINVSTNATVDIASLFSDTASEASEAPVEDIETDINDVLKNVNKDIKGSDILSEEEIAALFAAAGN